MSCFLVYFTVISVNFVKRFLIVRKKFKEDMIELSVPNGDLVGDIFNDILNAA